MGKVFLQFFFALKIVAIETLCLPQQSETNRPTAKRKKNSFHCHFTQPVKNRQFSRFSMVKKKLKGRNRLKWNMKFILITDILFCHKWFQNSSDENNNTIGLEHFSFQKYKISSMLNERKTNMALAIDFKEENRKLIEISCINEWFQVMKFGHK